jgi:hypothetical protein
MVREDCYRHLASSNRLIIGARKRIENQKAHIRPLKQEGYMRWLALLPGLEETLQSMYRRRETEPARSIFEIVPAAFSPCVARQRERGRPLQAPCV